MFFRSGRLIHINSIVFICFIVSLRPLSAISQNAQAVSVSPYVIALQQADGTTIHIIGKVDRHIPYTETEDGYTILKNDQNIYEYAKRASYGNLQLSGLKAKDAAKRSTKDKKFLSGITKHLRYELPFLDTLLKKSNKDLKKPIKN